jgi:hypothetical protein
LKRDGISLPSEEGIELTNIVEALPDISLDQLRSMMVRLGVKQLLVKKLSPNDNSKNQPYLSGSLDVVNILPAAKIYVDETKDGNRIMKAALALEWLQPNGTSVPAPHAKLILYPQYPEVRISGFLKGAQNAPNALMTTRMPGRNLFLGITDDRRIIAWCAGPQSQIELALRLVSLEPVGVFGVLPLDRTGKSGRLLLEEQLKRIHQLGWIISKRLNKDGTVVFSAGNGVGLTLEAELGIAQNGRSEPDFEGWEVKANQVINYTRVPQGTVVTLMTPQPDAGIYKEEGVAAFVRSFGYPDRRGRPDRLNFGSVHKVGTRNINTGLLPVLVGFDSSKGVISDPGGKYVLMADDGREAAAWSFARLLEKWNRKHAQAVYVPGEVRSSPEKGYRYGSRVLMAEGTNFGLFLKALDSGAVVYDPGIKIEGASGLRPRAKHRSQFRTTSAKLSALYDKTSFVDVI